jgi:hypothetical protein
MKRSISILVLATMLCINTTEAQQAKKNTEGITFGIRFGGNMNKITGKDSKGGSLKEYFKIGANVGVNLEIPIAANLYFQPGLLVTNKGSKRKEVIGTQSLTSTTYITYIEVPLNVLYKANLGTGKLLVGVGPYLSYAVLGQFKQDPGTNEKIRFKNTVKNTDPNLPYLKAFDAGLSILAGYQFKNRFSVQLNGQFGLAKINPKYADEPTDKSLYKNVGFGLSVGYRFHSRK